MDDAIDFGAINLVFDNASYKQVYAGIDFSPDDVREAFAEMEEKETVGEPSEEKGKPAFRLNIQIESCIKCKNPVYINEKFNLGDDVFHKACFRCDHCDRILTLSSYVKNPGNNAYYCEPHYKELFNRGGEPQKIDFNLDELSAANVDVEDLGGNEGAAGAADSNSTFRLSELKAAAASSESGWSSIPLPSESQKVSVSSSSPEVPPPIPDSPPRLEKAGSSVRNCDECGERPRQAKVLLSTGETKRMCNECIDAMRNQSSVKCEQCGERDAKKKVKMPGGSGKGVKLCLLCVVALTQRLADDRKGGSSAGGSSSSEASAGGGAKKCDKCKTNPREVKVQLQGKTGIKEVKWCKQCVEELQKYQAAVARDRPDLQSKQTLKKAGVGQGGSNSSRGSAVADRPTAARKLSGRPGVQRKGSAAAFDCERCGKTRAEAKVTLPDSRQLKLCKPCIGQMEKSCQRCLLRKAAAEITKDGRTMQFCRQCAAEVQRAGTLSASSGSRGTGGPGKLCERCKTNKASAKVKSPDQPGLILACTKCVLDLQAEAEGNTNAKLCSRCHVEPVTAKLSVDGKIHLVCSGCAKHLQKFS